MFVDPIIVVVYGASTLNAKGLHIIISPRKSPSASIGGGGGLFTTGQKYVYNIHEIF